MNRKYAVDMMSFKDDLGVILERMAKQNAEDLVSGMGLDLSDEVTKSIVLTDENGNDYQLSMNLKKVM